MRQDAVAAERAEEALAAHPNQELVKKITDRFLQDVKAIDLPTVDIDGNDVSDFLNDNDPEARLIDAREEEL